MAALVSCVCFLLMAGCLLVYVVYNVMQPPPASFVAYQPTKKPEKKHNRKKVSEENAIQPEGAAAQPITPVLIAEVSVTSVPIPFSIEADTDGFAASFGLGEGFGAADLGDGLGGGGDGLGSTINDGSALEGTFYDLKRKKHGASTGLRPGNQDAVIAALAEYCKKWDTSVLDRYYQSETKLYASSWYLPVAKADYGPVAFKVGDPQKPQSQWECKPSAWLAVYRGRVIAPKTGTFRFVGTGDDFFVVRFNNTMVLDAGYYLPTRWTPQNHRAAYVATFHGTDYHRLIARGGDPKRRHYKFITGIPGCGIWDNELGGLTAGNPFDVREGQEYDIEITISEIPGGKFGFVLFIEDITKGEKKRPKTFDLFRTAPVNPDPEKVMQSLRDADCYVQDNFIPFNEDSLIWEVVPMD